jgi:hypothetical protein
MRTNVAPAAPAITTHEGARAARINPIAQLRRSVLACMLWEDNFYEDGVSIADRIQAEVIEVLKIGSNGAQLVADLAFEARTRFKLRHVPLWLLVQLIHAQSDHARKVVARAIARVIQRPDELGELVSLYWKVNGKRVMLTHQMKDGIAAAYARFDEYALAKWDQSSAAVKLRDAMFLSHPNPNCPKRVELRDKHYRRHLREAKETAELTDREKLYQAVAANELKTPDTWESELSAGKDKRATFERLIAEHKLGAMALLRNLRGMKDAGVPDETMRGALATMKTERVLPFRFITAAKYAPQLEPELEQAMFRCLADIPKLAGKTVLVVDNSGSMYGASVSQKSELLRSDAACALAMLLREICAHVEIVVFSDRPAPVPPRRGFALRDAVQGATEHRSTNTRLALDEAARIGYDRCIVITDEQSHQAITEPLRGKAGYVLNVSNNQHGIGYGAWVHVDGWSEAVVDYILAEELM